MIHRTTVEPDSQTEGLGLEPGDVILTLHGHPVASADTWAWLTSRESDYAELRVRDARTGEVVTLHAHLGPETLADHP
jgi:hypothetical protein